MRTFVELLIAIVAAVIAVIIISLVFLLRTGKKPLYRRTREDDAVEWNPEQPARPKEAKRIQPEKYPSNSEDLTAYLIGGVRVLAGLAAVAFLVFIFTSTGDALKNVSDNAQITRIYTEGIFKAVITVGIAVAVYIMSKFIR